MLPTYTQLNASIANLRKATENLRRFLSEGATEPSHPQDNELVALVKAIDDEEKLIRIFRSDNEQLHNSLVIANQLFNELQNSENSTIKSAFNSPYNLGVLMMRLMTEPESHLNHVIQRQIKSIASSDAASDPTMGTYINNSINIMSKLTSVDDIIAIIQNSEIPKISGILQKQYFRQFELDNNRSYWSRVLLGSISLLLCAYVAILVYRLRKQTFRLTRQLEFEEFSRIIEKTFVTDQDGVDIVFSKAIEMLAKYFGATNYILIDFNPIENIYDIICEGPTRINLQPILQELKAQAPDWIIKGSKAWERVYYSNLQQGDIQGFIEGALSAGSMVATRVRKDTIGVLVLEHEELRKKPDSDEIRLLEQAYINLLRFQKQQNDNEEKAALEARLEHSQRLEAVGTLAGGIAHEFNNVLGTILGYGELALQLSKNSVRMKHYLQEIISSGHHAKHIIDQILTFSRKREHLNRPFDMREAVEAVQPFLSLTSYKGITVSVDIDKALPAVQGNPLDIQQIIVNLVTNGVQAMQGEGPLAIHVESRVITEPVSITHGELSVGLYVVLSVADGGVGIPSALLPHIFEPFFTTRSEIGGTGLGLSTVHGLVVSMNGKIDVQSTAGKGTQFDLYFPTVEDAPIPLKQFFNERTAPLGNGELVLVVEKDTGLRLMYEEKIAALGYEPVGFSNYSELQHWMDGGDRHPDAVLLDLDLQSEASDVDAILGDFDLSSFLFLADTHQRNMITTIYRNATILRKPVSSGNLASSLFKIINQHNIKQLKS